MHRAPSLREARGGVDGLEDGEPEGRGADFGDPAFVGDALGACDVCLFAQIAVLAFGLVHEGLHIHGLPVVEVGELEDGVVEAVFVVAVFAAGFGVGDGDLGM